MKIKIYINKQDGLGWHHPLKPSHCYPTFVSLKLLQNQTQPKIHTKNIPKVTQRATTPKVESEENMIHLKSMR